jgi:hypothetical protein
MFTSSTYYDLSSSPYKINNLESSIETLKYCKVDKMYDIKHKDKMGRE